jgi:hypothetical protein
MVGKKTGAGVLRVVREKRGREGSNKGSREVSSYGSGGSDKGSNEGAERGAGR